MIITNYYDNSGDGNTNTSTTPAATHHSDSQNRGATRQNRSRSAAGVPFN